MKPIKLKIKGLNSFQEEQTIDFIKLTDRGFFGIFGPTGSGKSTVLDGITLALYGSMARKSTNFINTNCDRVNVSFEFQISGAEVKKYSIDREFRRKKDESIYSGKCKLVDITNNGFEEVLADSVKALNKKVEEIIGLNIEDFTRTVVLPQGKFSEFLKLEGRDRRAMLERLFNLEKYGDELAIKLSSEIKKENNKNNMLIGQLKGYEDISIEKLNENQTDFKNRQSEFSKMKKELDEIEEQDKKNEELWNLQSELNEYKDKESNLKEKSEVIEGYKRKIKVGESAEKVIPYINAYESTLKSFEENKNLLEKLTGKIDEINKEKQDIENKWTIAKKDKDEKLSGLLVKEQKVKDAIEDEKVLKIIEEKLTLARIKKDEYEKKLEDDKSNLVKLEEVIKDKVSCIKDMEKKHDDLKIDEGFKEKIQNGLILEESIQSTDKAVNQKEEKIKEFNKLIEDTVTSGKSIRASFDELEKKLEENKNRLSSLLSKCPGDQNILLDFRKQISESEQKYENYNRLTADIKRFSKEREILEKNLSEQKDILKVQEEELKQLREKQKNATRESLAFQLREELKEGDVCPVCGSTHHIKENTKSEIQFDIKTIEDDITHKENTIKNINDKIAQNTANVLTMEKNIKDNQDLIKGLGEKFKEKSLENLEKEFEILKNSIEKYIKDKESLEQEINKTEVDREKQDGEIKALRATLRTNKNQLDIFEKELAECKKENQVIHDKLDLLKNETHVENFKEKNIQIREIEIERNKISNKIKDNRKLLESLEEKREEYNKEINLLNEDLTKKKAEITSYENNKKEKIDSIQSKTGNEENLSELLWKIQTQINLINDNYNNSEKQKNEIENQFKEYSEKFISSKTEDKTLNDRCEKERKVMESAINEEKFIQIEDVKNNIITKEVLENLKNEVEIFKESISRIQGAISSLTGKIGDRSITKEQYDELKLLKNKKSEEVKQLNETIIKLKDEISRISDKLKEQKELLEDKKALEHKMGLLSDLEKLFKGKKFVEFVAAHQLKYISIEASKRLKEITHGTYGLEVDENGKFIIRDYKNGGAKRDASTLSGGETFLASLALALALSAQIQLKGTAPLELFFLDEGFGTLDDELLEVVMTSLERIHNDKLKVGIISHVESIKNRVPVKLIITPSQCGMGGSKVKIERS